MLYFGHNGSLNQIDGAKVLIDSPTGWGPLIPKAEYLSQFGPIKAWEIYILPNQLRPQALEQLATAMAELGKHKLFSELDWLSFHFPTNPQSHHQTGEINQEKWRPFYQLLQVLDRFKGAKYKNLNFHILAEMSLPEVWELDKKQAVVEELAAKQKEAKDILEQAYKLRDHVNPELGLTIENNPPYHNKAHRFHLAGLFPKEIKEWQLLGFDFCLDVQHASLVSWYRARYGYNGPIPALNELHHRISNKDFIDLSPRYIHVAGAPDTPESLHYGSTIGAEDDDVDWQEWMTTLRQATKKESTPVIIELEDGHLPENWAACQASAIYLKKFI